ncbi:type II toxin-antitoxin system PemK/MazF family toxin (plasmid) [Coraliomargarita sp. W4R53]
MRPTATKRQTSASVGVSTSPGSLGAAATVEVTPPGRDGLTVTYAPSRDGNPDAGEVVWTWVPYVERDGRGKDRPVLVIGRQDHERVFAVKLTSREHDGDRDFLPIGAGAWDSQSRPSWVDIDQVYSVHNDGMRREAAALDLDRFVRVADALNKRYGWRVGR